MTFASSPEAPLFSPGLLTVLARLALKHADAGKPERENNVTIPFVHFSLLIVSAFSLTDRWIASSHRSVGSQLVPWQLSPPSLRQMREAEEERDGRRCP